MTRLLRVQELKTWFDTPEGVVRAVDGISFDLVQGQTLALVGESGSGKSISALSLLGLVPKPAGRIAGGHVWYGEQDLVNLSERQWRAFRGKKISIIFQEPQVSLNPVLTVGTQLLEALPATLSPSARLARAIELLKSVGLSDPERRLAEYPHQLSGGMKQRVMIAMALAGDPEILIADEPTTALDVTIQSQILDLLKDLQRRTGMALLLITHDLGIVAQMADRVAVMYAGEIVEHASRDEFFNNPKHPYSQKLFRSLPTRLKRGNSLDVIRGSVPKLTQAFLGCRFAPRCDYAWSSCLDTVPRWNEERNHGVRCHLHDPTIAKGDVPQQAEAAAALPPPTAGSTELLLRVSDLKVYFPIQKGVFRRTVGHVKAVDGVSLNILRGQTLALVGESGCGKTTVGKGILQLLPVTAGEVFYNNENLRALKGAALRRRRHEFQVIFQDPYGSLNPRMLVGELIEEGLRAQNLATRRPEREQRVAELLEHVGLPADARTRYPHEFSGGQRQRISIARALAVNPKLLVCDEPTSALDVSVQAQILNLLKRLQNEMGLSYLFITHNLAVVEYLAHRVAVMYLGRIVEEGSVDQVLQSPKHPYTQALLAAVPTVNLNAANRGIRLPGDIQSPANPPSGCHFHPRCSQAMEVCRKEYPGRWVLEEGNVVCCHLYQK